MKDLNKKVVSLLLSGALVGGVTPSMVSAQSNNDINYSYYLSESDAYTRIFYMNGIYPVTVNGEPVYVYLDNELNNKYVEKKEALEIGENNYANVYVFTKSVRNPYYVSGVSPSSERNIKVYALSGKSSVSGWTRVDKSSVKSSDLVATTIELGEFILSSVDISNYEFNMKGFGYADINKDGVGEVIYFGNNKDNYLLDKSSILEYAKENYKNYYFLSKSVPNPNYISGVSAYNERNIKVYSLSDKSYVNGWTRISKGDIPRNALVSTNTLYMDALVRIEKNSYSEEVLYTPSFVYNFMAKDEALKYAYATYENFCILTKTVEINDKIHVMYAFSFTPYVDGWTIIGNDLIPSYASIFLTMDDAYLYEIQLTDSYSKKLQ